LDNPSPMETQPIDFERFMADVDLPLRPSPQLVPAAPSEPRPGAPPGTLPDGMPDTADGVVREARALGEAWRAGEVPGRSLREATALRLAKLRGLFRDRPGLFGDEAIA